MQGFRSLVLWRSDAHVFKCLSDQSHHVWGVLDPTQRNVVEDADVLQKASGRVVEMRQASKLRVVVIGDILCPSTSGKSALK